MSGGVAFSDIIWSFLFLLALWFGGRMFRLIKLSSIMPEIAIGVVFHELHLLPFLDSHSPWLLLGNMGVGLMIAESGTHIDFEAVRRLGKKAAAVSLLGAALCVFISWGLFKLLNPDADTHTCFAVGATLAPTSIGIALKILVEENKLNSDIGQLIVMGAFIDDIVSLLLLGIVVGTDPDGESAGAEAIILPAIYTILLLVFGAFAALYIMPAFFDWLFHENNPYFGTMACGKEFCEVPGKTLQPPDEVIIGLFFLILACMTALSDLWHAWLVGAFATGLMFCNVPKAHLLWRSQIKRIANWFVRLFFACAVGFLIPLSKMMTAEAFGKGLCLSIFGGMLSKLVGGSILGKQGIAVGWAMVCRGEFAFYLADASKFDDETFAQVAWALVLTIIFGPTATQKAMQYVFAEPEAGMHGEGGGSTSIEKAVHHEFIITLATPMKQFGGYWTLDVCRSKGLDLLEAHQWTDTEVLFAKLVLTTHGIVNVDHKLMEEVKHEVLTAIGGQCHFYAEICDWSKEHRFDDETKLYRHALDLHIFGSYNHEHDELVNECVEDLDLEVRYILQEIDKSRIFRLVSRAKHDPIDLGFGKILRSALQGKINRKTKLGYGEFWFCVHKVRLPAKNEATRLELQKTVKDLLQERLDVQKEKNVEVRSKQPFPSMKKAIFKRGYSFCFDIPMSLVDDMDELEAHIVDCLKSVGITKLKCERQWQLLTTLRYEAILLGVDENELDTLDSRMEKIDEALLELCDELHIIGMIEFEGIEVWEDGKVTKKLAEISIRENDGSGARKNRTKKPRPTWRPQYSVTGQKNVVVGRTSKGTRGSRATGLIPVSELDKESGLLPTHNLPKAGSVSSERGSRFTAALRHGK